MALLIAPALSADRVAAETPLCAKTSLSWPQLVFEGLTYPYPREDGSCLFIDGGVYPYVKVTDNLLGDSTVALPGGAVVKAKELLTDMNLSDHAEAKLAPVVGYGSNPAPSHLSRKFAKEILEESVVIPVMKVDGKLQALAFVPAQGRTGPAIDSVAALSIVQPTVAPDESVVGMVQHVVSAPDTRAAYTKALAPFRAFKEKGQFSKAARDWRAPIGWSGLIVSASWASGLLERCFPAQADDIPMRCAA